MNIDLRFLKIYRTKTLNGQGVYIAMSLSIIIYVLDNEVFMVIHSFVKHSPREAAKQNQIIV